MNIKAKALLAGLRCLPLSHMSRFVGWGSRLKLPPAVTRGVIKWMVKHYNIDTTEMEKDISDYQTVEEFFIRRLKDGARPLPEDPSLVLSPVDAILTEFGEIKGARLTQAKGRTYSLTSLLKDPELVHRFHDGTFLTLWLSPQDYHRVHAPVRGRITGYRYISGRLYPVFPLSAQNMDELFSVNERLITILAGLAGLVAVVMVGATHVGRMTISYDAITTNSLTGWPTRCDYDRPKVINRGDELGVFHLGSTVILLFEPGSIELTDLKPGQKLRMGMPIGRRTEMTRKLYVVEGK